MYIPLHRSSALVLFIKFRCTPSGDLVTMYCDNMCYV